MRSVQSEQQSVFRVAAVIAVKDAEATIERAVSSALAQPEIAEVIVVDDGSGDQSPAIVERLAAGDERVTLIRLPESGGPAAARNLAIAHSNAPFIAVLDADDYWMPGRLAKLAPLVQDHDMVADDLLVMAEGEARATPLIGGIDAPADVGLEAFLSGNISRKDRFRREWGFLKPVMRREFLAREGVLYDPALRLGEDFMLYSQALAHGARFRLVGPCGYVSIQRPDSLSVNHTAEDLVRLLEAARGLARLPLSPGEARILRRYLRDLTVKTRYRQVLAARAGGGLPAAAKVLFGHADAVPATAFGVLLDLRLRAAGVVPPRSRPKDDVDARACERVALDAPGAVDV